MVVGRLQNSSSSSSAFQDFWPQVQNSLRASTVVSVWLRTTIQINVTCTLFKANCSRYDIFPANLSAGQSVSKPRDFQASPFRAAISVYDASGVKYEWKGPIDVTSRQHIKGFYLRMQPVGSGNLICRLFDLTAFDMSNSTSLRFVYSIFPLQSAETYQVKLASLPVTRATEGSYEKYVVSVLAPRDRTKIPVVYSADWKTWIIAQSYAAESTVEVKFGFPEKLSWADKASFTQYLIQLVNDQYRVSNQTTYIRRNNSGSVAVHNFTGVSSGRYRVQVQPKDTLRTDRAGCQCWKNGPFGIRDCQPCKTSVTKTFNFGTSTSTTSTTSTSTTSTTSSTVSEEPISEPHVAPSDEKLESSGPGARVIVPAVIVPVVLVAGLIAGSFFWKQRKAGGKAGIRLNRNENNVNGFSNVFRKFDTLVPGMGKELKVPQVTRKTVLLLASEDHKYFSQALNNFSTFLTLHCQCDVMFAPEQLADVRKTANSYCWLSGKINQADVVIIVTSQAACRQYQAFQKGQVYKEADLGPEGDLFTPGIKHICGKIASGEDVSKVMMVRFEHTASKHRLPISALPPSFYLLPTRLKSCLLHIHGLDENNMNLSTVNLPLQGNVQELQGGKEWLNAVSEAMAFEREHPAWFEEKFGRLVDTSDKDKPDYDTQVGCD
ncbi:uncharacterized protein [Littorina saxatilis]|uniref:uncharacterized protein isoform X2 n=1 Tax=Littorina saxatilis TaxID=31220 RepID=UPI0038B43502